MDRRLGADILVDDPLTPADITVVIPTVGRDEVLIDTLRAVHAQAPGAILVMDQSETHAPAAKATLEAMEQDGAIQWKHIAPPSITRAMNMGIEVSRRPLVLFLDDDIVPSPDLIAGHAAAYSNDDIWAVAGQVLQPGQEISDVSSPPGRGLRADLDFPFHSMRARAVQNGMAGNLSVRRTRAMAIGGFDENFRGVAYRFETDFCRRVCQAGGTIWFEPMARIRHLRAASGGTRRFGSHLTSVSPAHGVGDYYFAFRHGRPMECLRYSLKRPFREVCTRFHLAHPWFIPGKLFGEFVAMVWAIALHMKGPRCPLR